MLMGSLLGLGQGAPLENLPILPEGRFGQKMIDQLGIFGNSLSSNNSVTRFPRDTPDSKKILSKSPIRKCLTTPSG